MRVIIVGASDLGLDLTRRLINKGDEVILIEKEPDKAKKLAETLDCTVINAEGTRPDTLEKAEVTEADALVACVDNDQNNILIGLIARGYNVSKVIVQTNDVQFQEVAKKLGFRHVINLSQIASVIISDALREINTIELSSLVRGDVRFLEIIVDERFEGKKLSELELPDNSACIGLYRKNEFILYRKDPALKVGDGLVIVTSTEYIEKIYSQFAPPAVNSQAQ